MYVYHKNVSFKSNIAQLARSLQYSSPFPQPPTNPLQETLTQLAHITDRTFWRTLIYLSLDYPSLSCHETTFHYTECFKCLTAAVMRATINHNPFSQLNPRLVCTCRTS
ncbi:hypothetical protein Zmor_003420 [Zophobas morio]|uniref:Uncharacterized protein n=1 Tax=Zophobas morio TaxID=2755281 RepID=A0AA38M206_9CUCU|nr:hypothetical protein Zmor_003420 [Zophobas morio]